MLSKPRSADLLNRYPNITAQGVCEELKRSGYTGSYSLLSQRIRELRPRPEEESRQWMLRVLQCKKRSEILRPLVKSDEDLCIFEGILRNGKPKVKNRVLAVLAVSRGISRRSVSHILHISRRIVSSYCRFYNIYGRARLFKGFRDRLRKSDDELLQNTLFSVLHTPPTAYDINRTTWRMSDLRRVLAEKGQKACPQVIKEIIMAAGYNWRKARKVLTSTDPQYQEKLAKIQSILSTLGSNERFFSIDEYGPFAVKMHGGRSLMPPGTVQRHPAETEVEGLPDSYRSAGTIHESGHPLLL